MNSVSRLLWVTPITITLTGIFLAVYFNSMGKLSLTGRIIILGFIIILLILTLSIALFYHQYSRILENISYRMSNKYSSFIYNSINVRLEYLEKTGLLVSYVRDDQVTKLSLKKNTPLDVIIQSSGEIIKNDTSSINSSFSFSAKNTVTFLCHFNKEDREKQHHFTYSSVFRNSFLSKEESWTIAIERFCKQYCVDIVLPTDRELEKAELHTKNKEKSNKLKLPLDNTEEGWSIVPSPKMCLRHRKDSIILSIRISEFRPHNIYKIIWVFKD